MKALYLEAGRDPEEMETVYAETVLGGPVEVIHPFLDENICVALLLDRDGMAGRLAILDEDLYELEEFRGPALISRDDTEELTEEDLAQIEGHVRYYDDAGERNETNPYEDPDNDGPDDESGSHIHIVDGCTFGEMLRNERTEEQKYF